MYFAPNKRFKVVQITAPLFLPGQGDTDYTSTLNQALQKQSVLSTYPVLGQSDERKQGDYVKLIAKERIPGIPLIGHFQLRPPHGGTLLPPSYMDLFDHNVVTVHEFIHLEKEEARQQVIEYLLKADHVIFSTPYEQQAVEKYIPDIKNKSSIIPIFPSIDLIPKVEAFSPSHHRPPNIVCFSSIRAGKGMEDVLELARLIRDDVDLRKYQARHGEIKVYIVGKPVSARLTGMLVRNTYGIEDSDMPKLKDRHAKSDRMIAETLEGLRQSGHKKLLPIEIVTNASVANLNDICRNCNFAYLPIKRGATHHSTAVPVVMGNGCITITTKGGHTPQSLEEGCVEFASHPKAALNIIKNYIKHPTKARFIRKAAEEYVDNISPEQAAERHVAIYSHLLNRNKSLESSFGFV